MSKRRKGKAKRRNRSKPERNAYNKKGSERRSSHTEKSKTNPKRLGKERKEDIIFFSVLFIIVGSILGGYFIYDEYFKDGDRDTAGSDTDGDGSAPLTDSSAEVGELAPNFELYDIDDILFSLEEYRGNIVILSFMVDYDPLTIDELMQLNEVYIGYNNKGVEIITIDIDNTESAEQIRVNMKEAVDAQWRFAQKGRDVGAMYGVESTPTIYIIDQGGIITFKNSGLTDFGMLEEEIMTPLG